MSNVVDKSIATSQHDMCSEYPPALCLPVHSFMQLAGREKINQLWNASVVLILKGAFQKSELTGRIIAGPVILTMKNAFFQEFLLKNHLLRACYLGFD